jgi:hypothetical protein
MKEDLRAIELELTAAEMQLIEAIEG